MKKTITITALVIISLACKKKNTHSNPQAATAPPPIEKYGPYGKESIWKSVGGDTVFTEKLTLSYFYTEKHSPCNVCYYQQNISFWNDYDYTFSVSECVTETDSLIFTDIDSGRKAIFKREK